jgi:hypothetical protein
MPKKNRATNALKFACARRPKLCARGNILARTRYVKYRGPLSVVCYALSASQSWAIFVVGPGHTSLVASSPLCRI